MSPCSQFSHKRKHNNIWCFGLGLIAMLLGFSLNILCNELLKRVCGLQLSLASAQSCSTWAQLRPYWTFSMSMFPVDRSMQVTSPDPGACCHKCDQTVVQILLCCLSTSGSMIRRIRLNSKILSNKSSWPVTIFNFSSKYNVGGGCVIFLLGEPVLRSTSSECNETSFFWFVKSAKVFGLL